MFAVFICFGVISIADDSSKEKKFDIIIDYSSSKTIFSIGRNIKTTNINSLPNLCLRYMKEKSKKEVNIKSKVKLTQEFTIKLFELLKSKGIKIKSFIVPISCEPGEFKNEK
jgi:hypothetical protein